MNEPHISPVSVEAESVYGSRVLLAVGALALVLGAGFFFQTAFHNGTIGPMARVALGLLAGTALMLFSEYTRTRLQHLFTEAITALGACLLYLSLWAAGDHFHLVSIPIAYGAMMLVTGSLTVLSLRRNSELTAGLGLIGGFITPMLTQTGALPWTLTLVYVGILNAALLLIPRHRPWHVIAPAAFLFTQFHVMEAVFAHQADSNTISTLTIALCASFYLAIFSWRPAMRSIGHLDLSFIDCGILGLSAIAYYATVHALLHTEYRVELAAIVVALAFAYTVLAYLERSSRTIYVTLALALTTGGVAAVCDGPYITGVWALQGALLAWAAATTRMTVVRIFSALAATFSLTHLMIAFPEGGASFFNERFLTLIAIGIGLLASRLFASRLDDSISREERLLWKSLECLGNVAFVSALSDQFWAWSNHNLTSLSVVWAAYGGALLILGFATRSQYRRIQALCLLALATLKAFVVDMAALDPNVRIISLIALGGVLLAGSFLYFLAQRSLQRSEEA